MHFDPMRPIWLQVMGELETDIVAGKRQPGEKLPGGRELAAIYSINPNTAARVYQELEKAGMCETRRGMGTYVTSDTEAISTTRNRMVEQAVSDFLKRTGELGASREEIVGIILRQTEEQTADDRQ